MGFTKSQQKLIDLEKKRVTSLAWWRDLNHISKYIRALDHYEKHPNDLTIQEIINIYNKERSQTQKAFMFLIGTIVFIFLTCWLILKTIK